MNELPEIPRRILLEAHQIASKLPAILSSRKLNPTFSNFVLTSDGKMVLFIAVLDSARIGDHARYVHPDLLHQLSTDLGGRKVYPYNSTGLRLVIPLSSLLRSIAIQAIRNDTHLALADIDQTIFLTLEGHATSRKLAVNTAGNLERAKR